MTNFNKYLRTTIEWDSNHKGEIMNTTKHKAVLTIEEGDDDNLNLSVDFGEGGMVEDSLSHKIAAFAMQMIVEKFSSND